MGKATGFLEYQRRTPAECEPLERIKNWNEFSVPLEEEQLREQGARCMDCGTPFCHVGRLLSGMASGCRCTTSFRNGMTWYTAVTGR